MEKVIRKEADIDIIVKNNEQKLKKKRKLYQSEIDATNRYVAKNYDRMQFFVPKGQREVIRKYVQEKGESVNGFVNRLISEELSEHGVNFIPILSSSQESGP